MKLRNKKTGGVDDFKIEATGLEWLGYKSLKEFCEVWEDYEESERYWCISEFGNIKGPVFSLKEDMMDSERKRIGNYFETKEEAEKAVEKLKAWKRLKDRHFKFDDYDILNQTATWLVSREYGQYENDIKLLFGGEE